MILASLTKLFFYNYKKTVSNVESKEKYCIFVELCCERHLIL
jgi:hypothetical protein